MARGQQIWRRVAAQIVDERRRTERHAPDDDCRSGIGIVRVGGSLVTCKVLDACGTAHCLRLQQAAEMRVIRRSAAECAITRLQTLDTEIDLRFAARRHTQLEAERIAELNAAPQAEPPAVGGHIGCGRSVRTRHEQGCTARHLEAVGVEGKGDGGRDAHRVTPCADAGRARPAVCACYRHSMRDVDREALRPQRCSVDERSKIEIERFFDGRCALRALWNGAGQQAREEHTTNPPWLHCPALVPY